ncbi:DUF4365 domain-containing protein [Desulfatiglans anilini]|uniref:DUF4365 domain-containing protein n=1 Tax=Desulfatiglans anilini TaxID=90728 RepID=UPI0005536A54|nr:DUF4365 domain-containing protein [Desulfatiglans anilini]
MSLLPPIEIESELSYAYLHAVAAQAGMSCQVSERQADKMGVDAIIRAKERFAKDSIFTDLALDVQLKATISKPKRNNNKISYFLDGVDRYDKLRSETVTPPRILVVLFLPENQLEWLKCGEEELSLRRCAWWVSLKGAPPTENTSGTTIYLPENQYFHPDRLREIMTRLSREEELLYAG